MLKTNLGPKGTMKMLVSGAGDIKITKVCIDTRYHLLLDWCYTITVGISMVLFIILLSSPEWFRHKESKYRYFFGRLWKSDFPEPTPVQIKFGRLRIQANKGGSGSIH